MFKYIEWKLQKEYQKDLEASAKVLKEDHPRLAKLLKKITGGDFKAFQEFFNDLTSKIPELKEYRESVSKLSNALKLGQIVELKESQTAEEAENRESTKALHYLFNKLSESSKKIENPVLREKYKLIVLSANKLIYKQQYKVPVTAAGKTTYELRNLTWRERKLLYMQLAGNFYDILCLFNPSEREKLLFEKIKSHFKTAKVFSSLLVGIGVMALAFVESIKPYYQDSGANPLSDRIAILAGIMLIAGTAIFVLMEKSEEYHKVLRKNKQH